MMRTIHCQRIKDGERCDKPRTVKKQAYRTKYCAECAAQLQREMSRANYKRNRQAIRDRCNAKYKASGMSQAQKRKQESHKSRVKRTKCKCPTCDLAHVKSLFLEESERARCDSGKPYRLRCNPCKATVERDGFCDIAHAHNIVKT
jgi:hypothetical protein